MSDDNSKKVKVNPDVCIGCTLCTQICPDCFEMGDDGKAHSKCEEAPCDAAITDKVQQAVDSCPVTAISWTE